jgi:Histone methylation protein DOT1
MNFKSFGKILSLIRTHGIVKAARSVRHNLSDRYIEYKLGIATSQVKTKEDLGLTREEERRYDPCDYGSLRKLLTMLEIQPGRDVLVDFGAGMGRVVVLAGLFQFRRIIGVEISSELCEIAESNLNRARSKLICQDIGVVHGDATKFAIPPDMTVAFFFNPFTGFVLDSVLENIRNSIVETPRQVRIACNDYSLESEFARQMRACPWLQLRKSVPLRTEGQVGSIYVNKEITT